MKLFKQYKYVLVFCSLSGIIWTDLKGVLLFLPTSCIMVKSVLSMMPIDDDTDCGC